MTTNLLVDEGRTILKEEPDNVYEERLTDEDTADMIKMRLEEGFSIEQVAAIKKVSKTWAERKIKFALDEEEHKKHNEYKSLNKKFQVWKTKYVLPTDFKIFFNNKEKYLPLIDKSDSAGIMSLTSTILNGNRISLLDD